MHHRRTPLVLAALLALAACKDQKRVAEEKQRALEDAKAAQKAAEDAKERGGGPKTQAPRLDPFWDDAAYVRLTPDGPCPAGMWALFPGDAPGDGDEKKANAAQRPALAQKLREATFVLHLKAPATVTLKEYDAPKGVFPLDAVGTVDCLDSIGRIAIAWNPAKAITPGNSAAKAGAEITQAMWQADPTHYTLPVKSVSEAKDFSTKHRFDLDARLVFKLGKTDVHKKLIKTTKVTSGEVTMGGGLEDWGAGRLVMAEVQGVRISTDHEKTSLVENRGR